MVIKAFTLARAFLSSYVLTYAANNELDEFSIM